MANYINSELKRIAFFLQYAGVIEEHIPNSKTQKILTDLPVDWDDQFVLINNKKPSETTEDDYFYGKGVRNVKLPVDIQLKGKIGERPFIFKIKYGDNRHYYYIDFEDGEAFGHKKPILTIKGVQDIITKISQGEKHEDKDLGELYTEMFKGKAKYNQVKDGIISKFFSDHAHLNWTMLPSQDKNLGVIFLKIFATDAKPEEYKQVFSMFTEDDPERSRFKASDLLKNQVTNYVGSKIQDAGFDAEPSVSGMFRPKLDDQGNLSGKLGFTITIK